MMRIDIDFARPLDHEGQTRVLLALGQVAKVTRVRFVRGHLGAIVSGEALTRDSLRTALAGEGIVPQAMRTSLYEEAPGADDAAPAERVRPMGR